MILGISPGFLEDSQRMSEDALLLEIVRMEFQQVTGVVFVIVMDVGEDVVQPLAHIDLCQFAASHEGVDDGSIFGGIMVSVTIALNRYHCSTAIGTVMTLQSVPHTVLLDFLQK